MEKEAVGKEGQHGAGKEVRQDVFPIDSSTPSLSSFVPSLRGLQSMQE